MSIVRWNLKEAGGKIPNRGTRISLGTTDGMSLLNKTKSKNYTDIGVYMIRLHGMKVINLTTGGLADVWILNMKYG